MTRTRSTYELWLSVGIFLLRIYLPQTINPTTPIMILLIPMLKLFQLDTYYLVHEIGDQGEEHESKEKCRSSSAPPNNFSYRCNSKGKIFVVMLGRK